MDLKQIEYFVHVAEFGSFSRAATYLNVVQPALSRQVRQLEVELRQVLFERTGRGVTLTEAGRRLLEHGRGILQQVERARSDLEEQRDAPTGQFVLGLPPSLGRSLTVPLVTAFEASLPRARLATVEGLSTYVLEWLSVGRIDAALVYNPSPAAGLELMPLVEQQLFLVERRGSGAGARFRGSPVALSALASHPLIIPSRPHAIRMTVEAALARSELAANVALEIESIPAIMDLVGRGRGAAVLPMSSISSSTLAGGVTVRPIVKPPLRSGLWLALSAQRPRGPLVQKAVALVRDVVKSELQTSFGRAH